MPEKQTLRKKERKREGKIEGVRRGAERLCIGNNTRFMQSQYRDKSCGALFAAFSMSKHFSNLSVLFYNVMQYSLFSIDLTKTRTLKSVELQKKEF